MEETRIKPLSNVPGCLQDFEPLDEPNRKEQLLILELIENC